jgi:hypothetical protein
MRKGSLNTSKLYSQHCLNVAKASAASGPSATADGTMNCTCPSSKRVSFMALFEWTSHRHHCVVGPSVDRGFVFRSYHNHTTIIPQMKKAHSRETVSLFHDDPVEGVEPSISGLDGPVHMPLSATQAALTLHCVSKFTLSPHYHRLRSWPKPSVPM